MELAQRLAIGLEQLGLRPAVAVQEQLLQYVQLLRKWNRVYNLTAVRSAREMVARHVLDSLAILPFVTGPRVLDVGTGAGLPGIPLALMLPTCRVVLLDSRAKKIRFVRQAVAELALANAEVVCERVEQFQPVQKFDTLVTRALAPIPRFLTIGGHLCAASGSILIMKGTYPRQELAAIPEDYAVSEVKRLRVPGLNAQRHLVIIVPQ